MKPEHPLYPASDDSGESERSALDWPRDTGRTGDFMAAIAVRKRRQNQRRLQGAVALAVVLGVTGFAWRSYSPPAPPAAVASASMFVALPARQVLSDGSVVELKNDAEIAVEFTPTARRVVLRRGEAYFQVAKNPNRPFVVDVGGIEVRAVGTAFAVQHGGGAIEVLVTAGRVAVEENFSAEGAGVVSNASASGDANATGTPVVASADAAAAGGRTLAVLDAGHGVVVDVAAATPQRMRVASARAFAVSGLEMNQRLAWRAPRLDLSSTPLAQAISMINQHSAIQLVLGDEELGAVQLSGVLRADNVEPLLRMLENNYAIQAERSGAKIILRKSR